MRARGISSAELGRAVGITGQAVSQWLSPEGTMPRGQRLARIATALGVSVSELTAEAGGFAEAPAAFVGVQGPPAEYDRLPEQVELLNEALDAVGIRLPLRSITKHAQDALALASSMDRRLPFEERARMAAEAKAADLHRLIG